MSRRTRKSGPQRQQQQVPGGAPIRRVVSAAGWLLLVVTAVGVALFGLPWLNARAAAMAESELSEVVFHDLPEWLEERDREFLRMVVLHHSSADPLDRRALVQTRQALLDTGWFESIRQVARTAPDRVEVEGDFVSPFALVRDGAGEHLVDREGRLLPRTYAPGEAPPLWVLINPSFESPQMYRTPWPGSEVTAAIAVLELIEDRPWASQVSAVDLSVYPQTRRLTLVTDRGTSIIWGRSPGSESGAEVPASKKLKYLDFHYQRYGHVDGGLPGAVDITTDIAFER